jgi:hypothetical protein
MNRRPLPASVKMQNGRKMIFNSEDLSVYGRKMLNYILKEQDWTILILQWGEDVNQQPTLERGNNFQVP